MNTRLNSITLEDIDLIYRYRINLEKRLKIRREHHMIPEGFISQTLETFNSNISVLQSVDQATTGRFACMQIKHNGISTDVIAFEDPQDMTMFLMTYEPTPDITIEGRTYSTPLVNLRDSNYK